MSNKKKHDAGQKHTDAQIGPSSPTTATGETVSTGTAHTPACECHKRPCRCQEKPTKKMSNPDWWMVGITGFLGIAAFATFWVLLCQLWDARDNFARDQRPYIWPASIEKNPAWERTGNNQIGVMLHFTNFGKSPAFELHQIPDLEFGENALERVKTLPLGKYFTIAPTGYEETVPAVSGPLTEKQFTEYTTKDSRMVLYVRFQYKDHSGHLYESDVCSMYYATLQGWAYCPDHNDIKDCSEKTCEP